MPHQCVRCNSFYDDGSDVILKGCSCGAKLFFYVKKEKLEESKEITTKLTKDDRKQIEHDVFDILGTEEGKKIDEPVILDFESIRILGPGKFELDLVHLFDEQKPLVYKLEEGKYVIDIPETFRKRKFD